MPSLVEYACEVYVIYTTHILYKFRYPCFLRLTSGKNTCIFTEEYTVEVQPSTWKNSIYKKADISHACTS